jgi:protein-disulfide isomerase
MPAALASACAQDQGKFWEMHDIMFENSKKLSDTDLESYAQKIGLNMPSWKKCYADKPYIGRIKDDQKTAVNLGARGTPAFFINGRYLSGARPYENFKALVDEELAKAKASGIGKASYYQKAIVEKGKKSL